MGGRITAIVLAVLGVLCIALSAAMIVSDHRQIAEAKSWPRVMGRVEEARIDVQRGSSRNARNRYVPYVSYSYSVGGRAFRNHYIWLTATRTWGNRPDAAAFLSGYPLGGAVAIFYSPADPGRSALIVESSSGPFYLLGAVGLLLLGLSAFAPGLVRRSAAKQAARRAGAT
ncbi:MAG TPA: DUF3592 domain-containing protein [Allosphingosinicella sp.]|nr:DUF3592 domain-containing protein [Allosphingosinicella sp.]